MYKDIINELKIEINNVYAACSKEIDQIQKDWIKISYDKPKYERRLNELKDKCEILENSDIKELEEKSDLEIKLANYYNGKKLKEEKIQEIKEGAKTAIRYAVKRKIAQMIELSCNEKEQGIIAAKKMYESNSELDLKSVALQVKAYDRFVEALEEINKYNGCIRTDSFCDNLINEYKLDEYFTEIIEELYLIIVGQLLDMRKDVQSSDVSILFMEALEKREVVEEEKEAVENEGDIEETERIGTEKQSIEMKDEVEVAIDTEIEENKTIADSKLEEIEAEIDSENEEVDAIDTESLKDEVIEEAEDETEITSEENSETIEQQVVFEAEIEKEFEQKMSCLTNDATRFLELCNYVKLHLTQENMEDLNGEYQALQESCEACDVCYKSLVNMYNSLVENKSKKLVIKNTLDCYSKGRIFVEFLRKPFVVIKNSEYSEKRVHKKIEKIVDNALKYPKTSNEYIEKMEKAKVLESKIIKKYIIRGVKLFKAKNKLAKMKLKLYGNNNEFSSKSFERRFNKQTKKISKQLAPKLDKLTTRVLNNDSEECICLILNQYLDLISNCHMDDLAEFYTKYFNYLYSIEEKIGRDYFDAYKMAGIMVHEYRVEYKLPYELIKFNTLTSEIYNEVEDIVDFYQFETDNEDKQVLYVKRS